jgi:hypothetical protein
MALLKLKRRMWHAFCDGVTIQLAGKRAEIEIASLDLGAQVIARWLPLLGVVYDRKNDSLQIVIDGLDHMVLKPRELYAEYGPRGLESLGVLDSEGAWQILLLRDPLSLPAPQRPSLPN